MKKISFILSYDSNLGKAGDIVQLKAGYARFLSNINKGLIMQSSESKVNVSKNISIKSMIEKLKSVKQFTMKAKVKGANLARQYSKKNIVEIINKKLGFDIGLFNLTLNPKDESIKRLGSYSITINTQLESITIPINVVS